MKRLAILSGAAGVVIALVLGGTACGPPMDNVKAPACSDQRPESLMLVAQSVPTASHIPCVVSYPAGWTLGAVEVHRGQSSFRLHAESSALDSLEVTLRKECDMTATTLVATDEPGVDRYDGTASHGGTRLVRTYGFAGGCVRYDFHFEPPEQAVRYDFHFDQLKRAVVDQASAAVGFLTRAELEARYYEYAK